MPFFRHCDLLPHRRHHLPHEHHRFHSTYLSTSSSNPILHEYLTRKEEFTVLIIGLDGAGKTTFLEHIKTLYNDVPGLTPDKIAPTVGQNTGKITLPSTILQFWDLGGQRGIRNIWHRYYDDCHAVVYVIDADDRERLSEGWEVFDPRCTTPLACQ